MWKPDTQCTSAHSSSNEPDKEGPFHYLLNLGRYPFPSPIFVLAFTRARPAIFFLFAFSHHIHFPATNVRIVFISFFTFFFLN